ncbi:MAG: hypothetical protein IT374_00785 [Polyangiaceae bacterium]|nr:hypothetical protein [Polyangiaceae bacterium]
MNRADALAEYERALGAKIDLRAVRCGAGGLDGRVLCEAQLEAILAENTPDFPPRGDERAATVDPLRKSLRACLGELGLRAGLRRGGQVRRRSGARPRRPRARPPAGPA